MKEEKCLEENIVTLNVWDGEVGLSRCCIFDYIILNKIPINRTIELSKNGKLINLITSIFKFEKINKFFEPNKYALCGNKHICSYENLEIKELKVNCGVCNLRCNMCKPKSDSFFDYTCEQIKRNLDDYFNLLNSIKGYKLERLFLTTNGEPFYDFDRTYDFLKSITEDDFKKVSIITNCTLLDEEKIKKLSELKNVEITVSIDDIDEETYKKIRNNNMFKKVMSNTLLLNEHKLLKAVNVVIQKDNFNNIENIVNFWVSKNIRPNLIIIRRHEDLKEYKEIGEKYKKYLEGS